MGAPRAIYELYLKFLTQRNLVADFHQQNVSFTQQRIGVSEPPFWGLRANVCNLSLAHWRADSRLSIVYN